jgi:hypothetical protein
MAIVTSEFYCKVYQHFEAEVRVNNIEEFSPYLTEHTKRLHDNDKLFNAV